MISYHPDKENHEKEWMYTEYWRTVKTDDMDLMAKIICTFTNSPISWKENRKGFGGYRKKENFIECNWIALDFDNGIFLSDILEKVNEKIHIVGTTKNHQKPKKKELPWDRFRVWLKLEKEIKNVVEYEECMKWNAKEWGCDKRATDGAKKFRPCKEIVSIKKDGELSKIDREEIKIQKMDYRKFSAEERTMPKFISEFLQFGVTSGDSRNLACFKCGLHLTRCGYSAEKIFDMIMNSPIPKDNSNFVRNEVMRAIISGARHTG